MFKKKKRKIYTLLGTFFCFHSCCLFRIATDRILFTPAGSFRAQKCKDISKPGHLVQCLEGTISEYYRNCFLILVIFLFHLLFKSPKFSISSKKRGQRVDTERSLIWNSSAVFIQATLQMLLIGCRRLREGGANDSRKIITPHHLFGSLSRSLPLSLSRSLPLALSYNETIQ